MPTPTGVPVAITLPGRVKGDADRQRLDQRRNFEYQVGFLSSGPATVLQPIEAGKLPEPIAQRLRASARAAAQGGKVKDVMLNAGSPVLYQYSADFEKYVQADVRQIRA